MKSALIVIDLQNWFFRTDERRRGLPKLIKGTNKLINLFHEKRLPIVHVLTVHKKDRSTWPLIMKRKNMAVLIEGTREAQEIDQIVRLNIDKIIKKTRHSAFIRTELEEFLKRNKIDTLIIAGVFTHGCIGQTAIDGYERDLDVILAKDAIFSHKKLESAVMLKMLKEEYAAKILSDSQISKLLKGAI